MSKDLFVWDKDGNSSVKASSLHDITIYIANVALEGFGVRGWYDSRRFFDFGHFGTYDEAKAFVDALHKQIKETTGGGTTRAVFPY